MVLVWSLDDASATEAALGYVARSLPALQPAETLGTGNDDFPERLGALLGDQVDRCRHVVAASLREIGRPVGLCVERWVALDRMGVTIHSIQEHINTYLQPHWKRLFIALAAIPEADDHAGGALDPRARLGRAPFGFRKILGRLVEDDAEQAVVARIIGAKQRGVGVGEIAKGLNRDGVRPQKGRTWKPIQVERVLNGLHYQRHWLECPTEGGDSAC